MDKSAGIAIEGQSTDFPRCQNQVVTNFVYYAYTAKNLNHQGEPGMKKTIFFLSIMIASFLVFYLCAPQKPEPYFASPELIEAVNIAIHLNRPLLLEGEAGCGKTRLAYAVAYELGLPFYPWYVHSTSKAREGLYKYDAILRLHDVQTTQLESQMNKKPTSSKKPKSPVIRDPRNPKDYREFGGLFREPCALLMF